MLKKPVVVPIMQPYKNLSEDSSSSETTHVILPPTFTGTESSRTESDSLSEVESWYSHGRENPGTRRNCQHHHLANVKDVHCHGASQRRPSTTLFVNYIDPKKFVDIPTPPLTEAQILLTKNQSSCNFHNTRLAVIQRLHARGLTKERPSNFMDLNSPYTKATCTDLAFNTSWHNMSIKTGGRGGSCLDGRGDELRFNSSGQLKYGDEPFYKKEFEQSGREVIESFDGTNYSFERRQSISKTLQDGSIQRQEQKFHSSSFSRKLENSTPKKAIAYKNKSSEEIFNPMIKSKEDFDKSTGTSALMISPISKVAKDEEPFKKSNLDTPDLIKPSTSKEANLIVDQPITNLENMCNIYKPKFQVDGRGEDEANETHETSVVKRIRKLGSRFMRSLSRRTSSIFKK